MDAYATAGVFRTPYIVKSCNITKVPFSRCKQLVSGFTDEGHLGYYSAGRQRISCGVDSDTTRREVKVKGDRRSKKVIKKRTKLLKNLSRDLSTFTQIGFGLDSSESSDWIDQHTQQKAIAISEAAESLLNQLQALKVEEKSKGKKCKSASQMQMGLECDDSSSSSSSESSDSEGEECRVNMKRMKPEAELKQVVENAPLMLSNMTTEGGVVDSIETAEELKTATQRIEVCMGGKCKKSGSQVILEELERAIGIQGAVCGCKCLGKCRDGPNLRVSSSAEDDGVKMPLCLGVGVQDVSSIAANFLRGSGHQLGLAATPL